MDLELFRNQIVSDIKLIQEEFGKHDPNLSKDEFAFNYWILSRIYSFDEEIISNYILEYNDKSIDCYAHFEDSKELFIIQNKFYDINTSLDRKEVSDFLKTPLSHLMNKTYKRSQDLQRIFTRAIEDPEYKIWFDFYISNEKKSDEHLQLFSDFNKINRNEVTATMRARMNYLSDIHSIYFGDSYKKNIKFSFEFNTVNNSTVLKILPEEYKLEGMSEAHYVMTPISQLYEMYNAAIKKGYPIFEENIREYLGKSGVNGGIIRTLNNKDDRKNFFYYNNGITVICEKRDKIQSSKNVGIKLIQPQIVNGCQTVNSINEVLSDYSKSQIEKEFENVYVMVKVLIFNEEVRKVKPTFYQDIVKFTNKQNSINEKAFAARNEIFKKLKSEFKRRGFLLSIKPSDNYQYKKTYTNIIELNKLLSKSEKNVYFNDLEYKSLKSIIIPLEKLLQVYIALKVDGHIAYTKKSNILKPNSDLFKDYSLKIQNNLSIDNMIRIYVIFMKAEMDKKNSEDLKTPIPLYLISFLGHFLKNIKGNKYNEKIDVLFNNEILLNSFYNFLRKITVHYRKNHELSKDYNSLIKQKIDPILLEKSITTIKDALEDKNINSFIDSLS